ncbi:MAG TPA: IS110 family transposase [Syntrophomonas sp.]|nr:IS110 family transposase [Syntrophomonas sp.]
MQLYTAFDLHANNSYAAIIDENGRKVAGKKLSNDPQVVLSFLEPYRDAIQGIVVESTFNWYWLVDIVMSSGYKAHLANTTAIQKYNGLKHCGDKEDAFWLAEMLRLGVLPQGYIYPKEERPIRDLLRKRAHLVRLRTSLILSLQNIVDRNCGKRINVNQIKKRKENLVAPYFEDNGNLSLIGGISKEAIDFFTVKILELERFVEGKMELKQPYQYLLSVPGIGKILGLTIMLETGPVERFAKTGNYVSYCRKVSTRWISNDKTKGKGNKKNGNKYLAWAFSEAAEFARRYDEKAKAYYNRKMQKTNFMVAHNALAHKLARAAYHIMRDQVPFMPDKLFTS